MTEPAGAGTARFGDERPRVTDELLTCFEAGVLHLTLNRPDARNALTHDLRNALVDALEEASADLAIRAIVLTGAGEKAFCTGADLRSRPPAPERPEAAPAQAVGDGARMIRTGWQRLIAAVLDCEKPIIAAVNGTAAGGGAHLALACDLVVMAERARLIEVFVRRGIMPDAGGAYLLTRLVGPQRAKQLCFFGDDVSAERAEHLGLANAVVGAEALATTAAEWATRLAEGPTKAIGMTKALVNRAYQSDRATAFAEEAWGQELIVRTEDASEGMRAFAERRTPEFHGW
jgi:2-(1,2-epoxy-1,2-dihydrophenyl)acetyl-CoA isomerase